MALGGGSETSFAPGREPLEVLAGLTLTAKAVERRAEALGADIGAREQAEIQRAKPLELGHLRAPAAKVLYIEMDGTGVPAAERGSGWPAFQRSGPQERDRGSAETLGRVLDRARSQRHPRSALLPEKGEVRRRPGNSLHRRLISHIYAAHPVTTTPSRVMRAASDAA